MGLLKYIFLFAFIFMVATAHKPYDEDEEFEDYDEVNNDLFDDEDNLRNENEDLEDARPNPLWFRRVVRRVGRVVRRVGRFVRRTVRKITSNCIVRCVSYNGCLAKTKFLGHYFCSHLRRGCSCRFGRK